MKKRELILQEPFKPKVPNITKKMKIGEVTEKYPETKTVFSKHGDKSCFDCPVFGTKDINLPCMMHN